MTAAQRLRFEHIANREPLAPRPTVEDIRILLEHITGLEYARDAALDVAGAVVIRLVETDREEGAT